MKKDIFKHPSFYIAIASFFIGFFFIFQEGSYMRLNSYLWQLNFIFNLNIARKAAPKNEFFLKLTVTHKKLKNLLCRFKKKNLVNTKF